LPHLPPWCPSTVASVAAWFTARRPGGHGATGAEIDTSVDTAFMTMPAVAPTRANHYAYDKDNGAGSNGQVHTLDDRGRPGGRGGPQTGHYRAGWGNRLCEDVLRPTLRSRNLEVIG